MPVSAAAPRCSMLWVCAFANSLVLCLCRAAEEAASARQVLHLGRFFSPMDVTITATTWKQRQLHIQFQSHRSRCECCRVVVHSSAVAKAAHGVHRSSLPAAQKLAEGPTLLATSGSTATRQEYGTQSCP